MKTTLLSISTLLTVLLLSGCPDSKLPKVPPSTPEPKAISVATDIMTIAGNRYFESGRGA